MMIRYINIAFASPYLLHILGRSKSIIFAIIYIINSYYKKY